MAELKKLTKEWREFADAWISFLKDPSTTNKERLHKSLDNYWVGENESEQEDWIRETKGLIKKIAENDRDSWRKIYNFIKERYHEHPDLHKEIVTIAHSKNIGQYVWVI